MGKGEQTRQHILDRGMLYSSQQGLVDLSIGTMAQLCGMSRTGVISHFKNKEDMQLAILHHAEEQFKTHVLRPSREENPLLNLESLLLRWVDWTHRVYESQSTSCPFIKALVDYEYRTDSAVKALVSDQQRRLIEFMEQLISRAQSQGQMISSANPKTLAVELYSLYVGTTIAAAVQPTLNRQDLLLDTLQRYRPG